MTGIAEERILDELDIARRRIRIRAWRRGMREMDLIMGGFVDARANTLGAGELAELEALLDVPDAVAFAWFRGAEPIPHGRDTPLFREIAAFHAHEGPIH